MPKTITVNTGANMFKTNLVAWLRRTKARYKKQGQIIAAETIQCVIEHVQTTDERAAKRKGGLGRF